MNRLNHGTILGLIESYETEIKNYMLEKLSIIEDFMKDIPDNDIPDDFDYELKAYVDLELARRKIFESRIDFLKIALKRLYRENRAVMGIETTYPVSKDEARAVPIENVCGRLGIDIRRNVGLCPLHEERTPSFRIYPNNNSWYCFGCGEGGDVIDLVMKTQGLSFSKALKFILS